jgi:hypothetical protein
MTTQTSVPAEIIEDVITRALAKWPTEAARISRAADMLRAGNMIRTFYTDAAGEKKYQVRSQATGAWAYYTTEDACDCPDHLNRPSRMCKHRWLLYCYETAQTRAAVLAARAERVSREDLPHLTTEERARLYFQRWRIGPHVFNLANRTVAP